MLSSTEERDRDQVVYRNRKKALIKDEIYGTMVQPEVMKRLRETKILMVDLIWIWFIPGEKELLSEAHKVDQMEGSSNSQRLGQKPDSDGVQGIGKDGENGEQMRPPKNAPWPDTILTSFPPRWCKKNHNDPYLFDSMNRFEGRPPPITSSLDLLSLILSKCTHIFDPSAAEEDGKFMEYFESEIGEVVCI